MPLALVVISFISANTHFLEEVLEERCTFNVGLLFLLFGS